MLRLLCEGAEHARVGATSPVSALLVHRVALEGARLERSVDFGGNEFTTERRVGVTAVDDRFLAALDRPHDVGEKMVFDEGIEVSQELFFERLFRLLGELGRRVLPGAPFGSLDLLVVADEPSFASWQRRATLGTASISSLGPGDEVSRGSSG
jgi:hypothetical protein